MLAVEGLLKALLTEEDENNYENRNNDHDFSEVLKYCGDPTTQEHTVRYADGKEKSFTFNK